MAVEILEGVIRVKMARGLIVHTVRVNDGQWHKMHLSFYPSMIEVMVVSFYFLNIYMLCVFCCYVV